jgi:hypothetical protein
MIVASLGSVATWQDPVEVANRLGHTHGRWHYRCAPAGLRRLVAAFAAAAILAAALAVMGCDEPDEEDWDYRVAARLDAGPYLYLY